MSAVRVAAALIALLATACATPWEADMAVPQNDRLSEAANESVAVSADTRLAQLVDEPQMPSLAVPGAAIAVLLDGEIVYTGAAGAAIFDGDGITPARALTPQSAVRAASMSKLATALAAGALEAEGRLDLDADIRPRLGYDPRTGAAYDAREGAPVSLRALPSHTSGICDPAAYWAPLGETLESLVAGGAACEHAPGEGWAYANINYALAAEVMEHATGERFDQIAATRVLAPAGIGAGFNWSGVSAQRRAAGAALHRFEDGRWVVQVDGPQTLASPDPAILTRPGADLSAYEPGTNGTLFSPQGGLRITAPDLARLAALFLPDGQGASLARPVDVAGGNPETGVLAWGSGPQILTPGQIEDRPGLMLVGYSGEAYGLYGGAWADPERDAAIAFFVTGVDPAGDATRSSRSGLTHWEAALMDIALDVLDARRPPHLPGAETAGARHE
jgi:CubicO group peptidase (beta-lactamase class C family)